MQRVKWMVLIEKIIGSYFHRDITLKNHNFHFFKISVKNPLQKNWENFSENGLNTDGFTRKKPVAAIFHLYLIFQRNLKKKTIFFIFFNVSVEYKNRKKTCLENFYRKRSQYRYVSCLSKKTGSSTFILSYFSGVLKKSIFS